MMISPFEEQYYKYGCSFNMWELLGLDVEEIRALYKVLEHEYIPYENEQAHRVLKRISDFLKKQDDMAKRTS